jgi:hypothetical protein
LRRDPQEPLSNILKFIRNAKLDNASYEKWLKPKFNEKIAGQKKEAFNTLYVGYA